VPPRLRTIVERQTLADQVYVSIKAAIIEGTLRPGERLRENEIALSLGASRTPVREALSRLEHDGLVTSLKTGGSTVVDLSENDMKDIFGLIRVLETYATRLAAQRITPKQLERLDALCTRAERLANADYERLSELNRQFHEQVIEASGNRRLQALLGNLRSAMQPYRALTLQSPKFRAQSVRDHRRIFDLLQKRDVQALETLMSRHLEVAQEVTLDSIRARAERLALPR
jgi:DNA-binding GntR family transcriptional regulator